MHADKAREAIVPPENGEADPEWRAIRRAIDQFAGRIPTISKHRAVHNEHLAKLVARLDATGDKEAADTIVWQCWFRALDRERERFLLPTARTDALREALDEIARRTTALAQWESDGWLDGIEASKEAILSLMERKA